MVAAPLIQSWDGDWNGVHEWLVGIWPRRSGLGVNDPIPEKLILLMGSGRNLVPTQEINCDGKDVRDVVTEVVNNISTLLDRPENLKTAITIGLKVMISDPDEDGALVEWDAPGQFQRVFTRKETKAPTPAPTRRPVQKDPLSIDAEIEAASPTTMTDMMTHYMSIGGRSDSQLSLLLMARITDENTRLIHRLISINAEDHDNTRAALERSISQMGSQASGIRQEMANQQRDSMLALQHKDNLIQDRIKAEQDERINQLNLIRQEKEAAANRLMDLEAQVRQKEIELRERELHFKDKELQVKDREIQAASNERERALKAAKDEQDRLLASLKSNQQEDRDTILARVSHLQNQIAGLQSNRRDMTPTQALVNPQNVGKIGDAIVSRLIGSIVGDQGGAGNVVRKAGEAATAPSLLDPDNLGKLKFALGNETLRTQLLGELLGSLDPEVAQQVVMDSAKTFDRFYSVTSEGVPVDPTTIAT